MANENNEIRLLVDHATVDYINSYMCNGLEFDDDEGARAFLIEEIGLKEQIADEVMKYADDFRRNPFMELGADLVPLPLAPPGQRRRSGRK